MCVLKFYLLDISLVVETAYYVFGELVMFRNFFS